MSLVKKPAMTESKIAANRRNRSLSRGPTTEQGKQRIGAAQLRHGLYAKAENAALRALGENPAQFEELLEGLCEEFRPRGTLQERLVVRLARVLWLSDRDDRWHEGAALRRAKSVDSGRDNRLHARLMRLKMTASTLQSLVRSVATVHYVTLPSDLELMKGLQHEPELEEMGEIAVALFIQLQDPGAVDEAGRPTDTLEAQQRVLMRIKEIFGLAGDSPPPVAGANSQPGGPQGPGDGTAAANSAPPAPVIKRNPYPHIGEAQREAREPVRQLLENILNHQGEACEAKRLVILKDAVAGPSPFERAAEIAPGQAEALLMRRVHDANLRELRRITNLLLKIQRQEGNNEAFQENDENDEGEVYHDIAENKES